MAGGQVCCCGTNRGWLLFIVSLDIIVSFFAMFVAVGALVIIGHIDFNKLELQQQEFFRVAQVILWVSLAVCAVVFLLNLLPVIAEIKKKPKLLLAYRNWIIVMLIFGVIHLCLIFAGVNFQVQIPGDQAVAASGNGIVQGIGSLLLTIFTLVLVQRRMEELQEEIGETSFLKFI